MARLVVCKGCKAHEGGCKLGFEQKQEWVGRGYMDTAVGDCPKPTTDKAYAKVIRKREAVVL